MEPRRGAAELESELEEVFNDPAPIERALGYLVHLHQVACGLGAARTVADLLEAVDHHFLPYLGAKGLYLAILDDQASRIEEAYAPGYDAAVVEELLGMVLDVELPGTRVLRTGEAVWLESPEAGLKAFPGAAALIDRLGDRALCVLPLDLRAPTRGALGVAFAEPHVFDDHERRFLTSLSVLVAQALVRIRADVAERRAREVAERASAEHARAEALLGTLLDSAPIGFGFLDGELRWRRVNRTLATLSVAPSHPGPGFAEHLGFFDEAGDLTARLRSVLATGRPLVDVELRAAPSEAPGVIRRIWQASFYPVEVQGEIIGLGTLLRDVTEVRAADAFRRHVAGVVGHDLRTPLAAVRMGIENLRDELTGDPRCGRLIDGIERSARRMSELVEGLLEYGRLSSGDSMRLERRPVDLGELCAQAVHEVAASRPDRELHFIRDAVCQGSWDPSRLAQVITNLVVNALAHGADDRPVTVRVGCRAERAVLSVHNLGPAIPADALERVFEPFERGPRARSTGHGLGLFIVRQLVSAHGGTVAVRSSEREGTTFEVTLPV